MNSSKALQYQQPKKELYDNENVLSLFGMYSILIVIAIFIVYKLFKEFFLQKEIIWLFPGYSLKKSDRIYSSKIEEINRNGIWDIQLTTLWKHRKSGNFIISKTSEVTKEQTIQEITKFAAEAFIRDNAPKNEIEIIINSWNMKK